MNRPTKLATMVLLFTMSVAAAFALGNASGLYLYPKFHVAAEPHHDDDHDHELDADEEEDHHDEEEDHVALTKQAFENLNLRLGHATRGDYWKSQTVPGEVIEVPGRSELSVPAPVAGVIERVLVNQGQSVSQDEQIAELRITDEELTQSQSKLLATLARQEVVREEIARLEPLTRSGTVPGTKKRELEYELRQLVADQTTKLQELRARGLSDSVLDSIVNSRSLANKLFVALPKYSDPTYVTKNVSLDSDGSPQMSYSVERLYVHPGKTVQRGETLCSLTFHAELQIRGTAFESDLPILDRLADNDWKLTAEFGHDHQGEHTHRERLNGLHVLHINNRANVNSQTFDFFVPITNEVKRSTKDSDGRVFQQWRFKPGQRVHLRLPKEQWTDQLLLPNDAVVVEGPNAFVFVEHIHEKDDKDHQQHHGTPDDETHDDHDHDVFIELEPVPVRLLHRDAVTAVIANDNQIHPNDRLALNNAFKLHLAMKMQTGGGGGHHHHHDH